MDSRIQIVAILGSLVLLLVVLEMVRRRRLQERYALVWLGSALILLALAAWRDGLGRVSDLLGIAYPPNALFFIAFAFVLLLLLHFSSAVSRLADQSKILAQRIALLEQRVGENEQRLGTDGEEPEQGVADDDEWSQVASSIVEQQTPAE